MGVNRMPRTYDHKLSRIAIAEATRLRFEESWPWLHIAHRFGVDVKTIRRHCDPGYNRASYGIHENLGAREAADEHRRRMYGDLKFKQRVLRIRRMGASEAKHIVLGVVTECGTNHPKFTPALVPFVRGSSPIADC